MKEFLKRLLGLDCKHKWSEPVKEKGRVFQRCAECGKVVYITLPECAHKWDTESGYEVGSTRHWGIKGHCYILKCIHCGEITQRNIKTDEF